MPHMKPPRIALITPVVLFWTVKSLEATKDAITAAAPVPGLSIALNTVIELLKKIQEARSNSDALVTLCLEATSLATCMRGLAGTVQDGLQQYPEGSPQRRQAEERVSGPRSMLVGRVERLATDLRTICAEADKLSKRGYFAKFVYSTGDAEAISGMKDRMRAACQRFQMEGNVAIEALVIEILDFAKTADEERILDRLPRAGGAHYLSAANAMKARLQKGTREEVFARLEEWEEGQFAAGNAPPVLVLIGEAGTGKSTIASEFSNRLERRKRYGASYFFTRGVEDLNSPRKVFSTIASQLARTQPALHDHIVDAAREHLKTETLQQLQRQFDDLLRKPLGALSSSHPPIFVVVDALDECTEEGSELVPSLLRLLLSAAVRPGSRLRVFLTSRPEPHYIHTVFTDSDLKPHISTISIQEFRTSVDRDIECLISTRFAEHKTSKAWLEQDSSRLSTLVEKSEGLFIYSRTVVDFIIGDGDDPIAIQERYDIVLHVESSRTGFAPIDTLYLTVLQSVFPPRDQYASMQERLKRVLGYLVAILDPDGISPTTLEKLTGMPTAKSVPILNKLRSIVLFDRDNVDSRFRIIHATFREFLGDHSRSGDAFYVRVEEVHGRLADECTSAIYSGAVLLLRLFTHDPQVHTELSHLRYAWRYRNHHLSLSDSVRPNPLNCQWTREDELPTIASLVSYLRDRDAKAAWDLVCTFTEQLPQYHLSTWDRLKGFVSSMHIYFHNLSSSERSVSRRDCLAVVSIILDIQAVATDPHLIGPNIRTKAWVNQHFVQELECALSRASEARSIDDISGLLEEIHLSFHKAIIEAGLAPGHRFENEYDADAFLTRAFRRGMIAIRAITRMRMLAGLPLHAMSPEESA